jgi:predicted AAA+ superfamily ATPase
MFKRPVYETLYKRLNEKRRFIQVLFGPRQTGKTTLARQLIDTVDIPSHYASADEPSLKSTSWIEQQWEVSRAKVITKNGNQKALFVLDEVQKIPQWSEIVKRLWDEDSARNLPLHIILLGSSPLLVQSGLKESLAGRFEVIPVTHWSYAEMHKTFGWNAEQYIYFGGYPGAAQLISEPQRWSHYIVDSLIETTISRDILLMKRIDKPALLRRLFELGCAYSGEVLSYQKMLGQLHDAGNTTTLAHYLELLDGTGLLTGLPKYAGEIVRQRGSSPKFQVYNTALMTAPLSYSFEEARKDTEYWGRLTESAVGASLLNGLKGTEGRLFYWLYRNREVDFVIQHDKTIIAIEVKTGRKRTNLPGIQSFSNTFKVKRKLLVGTYGIPVEEFLLTPPGKWME